MATSQMELFALILGLRPNVQFQDNIVGVPAASNITVSNWKTLLVDAAPVLDGYSQMDVSIWKLHRPIPGDDTVNQLGDQFPEDLSSCATKMSPVLPLSHYFPDGPPAGHLHVVAKVPSLPSAGQKRARSPRSSSPPRTPKPRRPPDELIQITPPRVPVREIVAIRTAIDFFEERIFPLVYQFIGKPRPHWEPPESVTDASVRQFYNHQKIPQYRQEPLPLMYRLDQSLPNSKVDAIFQNLAHCLIYNTSGSGKTRFILECLHREFGFYFVAEPGPDGIGWGDVRTVVHAMASHPDWAGDIFKGDFFKDDESRFERHGANIAVAHKLILKMLVSRGIVFRTFIKAHKEINGGQLTERAKHDWVIFQTLTQDVSSLFQGRDPFTWCTNSCLVNVGTDTLQTLIAEDFTPHKILDLPIGVNNKFLYILDEAQVASREHDGCFMNENGTMKRPVLRPFIQTLLQHQPHLQGKILVSGTGFHNELLNEILTSGVGKDLWDIKTDISDFMDEDNQRDYVAQFLPPCFLASQSGQVLIARMYDWARGRPRFSAHYLQKLLRSPWKGKAPGSPHFLLDAYVFAHSNYCPVDGPVELMKEEIPLKYDHLSGVGTFAWDRVDGVPNLLDDLAMTIFYQIVRGEHLVLYRPRQHLVEYGLARLIAQDASQVDEPLALISIVRHFETHGYTLAGSIRRTLQYNKAVAFENIVLYGVTQFFQSWETLGSMFSFYDENCPLAGRKGRIVSRTRTGEFVGFNVVTDQPVTPSSGIATKASNIAEVTAWIENGTTGWCIPDMYMGPDLLAWIELEDGRPVLLAIQAKCYTSTGRHLTGDVTNKAIQSLDPGHYYADLVRRQTTPEDELTTRGDISRMLAAINLKSDTALKGGYNVLGVLAAFPLAGNLETQEVARKMAKDSFELAEMTKSGLRNAHLGSNEGCLMMEELLGALEWKREQEKRKRQKRRQAE
ncbi:hypothetical protein FRC17_010903 [Serendipita sp. 399]|nr:hypothetical protein FRC17_010903 [Serendipita sp. 399]